jgi:hypothetical protein
MEIHAPHGPVRSLKEFLTHIAIITIGILIALSLEQSIEWRHNRHLVQEARTNIVAEMQANQQELHDNLPRLKQNEELLRRTLTYVNQLKDHKKTNEPDIKLNLNFFFLQDTSWNTAQSTGALGLMHYDEVQDFAFFYGLQRKLDGLEYELERSWLQMSSAIDPLNGDVSKFDRTELDEVQRLSQIALANLQAVDNIATSLDQQYAKKLNNP